jgi:hypothetical protein
MSTTLMKMMSAPPAEADAARRQALRSSLRSWRSAVDPAHMELPARTRQRPGLSREDVGELTGMGACWYTQFENACSTHYSQRAVDRVANALRLSDEDRAILQILASRETFRSVRVILEGWIRWKSVPRRFKGATYRGIIVEGL